MLARIHGSELGGKTQFGFRKIKGKNQSKLLESPNPGVLIAII
uniref:Uncharacterized protein n=1 Tax=Anguilla anguilla TaxID=7936 RepID=A0A0E9QW28_ANGAN